MEFNVHVGVFAGAWDQLHVEYWSRSHAAAGMRWRMLPCSGRRYNSPFERIERWELFVWYTCYGEEVRVFIRFWNGSELGVLGVLQSYCCGSFVHVIIAFETGVSQGAVVELMALFHPYQSLSCFKDNLFKLLLVSIHAFRARLLSLTRGDISRAWQVPYRPLIAYPGLVPLQAPAVSAWRSRQSVGQ